METPTLVSQNNKRWRSNEESREDPPTNHKAWEQIPPPSNQKTTSYRSKWPNFWKKKQGWNPQNGKRTRSQVFARGGNDHPGQLHRPNQQEQKEPRRSPEEPLSSCDETATMRDVAPWWRRPVISYIYTYIYIYIFINILLLLANPEHISTDKNR